ncbi:MAG: M48 family metallopeptidase, partial [Bdellovibrionales bacterium]|nr:M48 family metallopeptidase [Bdellovibrionales bacterium]
NPLNIQRIALISRKFPGIWKFIMKKLLLLALTLCSACIQPPSPANRHEGRVAAQALINEYGKMATNTAVLNDVLLRIVTANQKLLSPNTFSLHLLATLKPLAFSTASGEILISRGLIHQLQNEGEFAFILAHEVAHISLHTSQVSYKKDQEQTADALGVKLLIAAGYDPRVAITALQNSYQKSGFYEAKLQAEIDQYPSLAERVALVAQEIRGAQWAPPGTVNRRAYTQLRHLLLTKRN